MRNNLGASFSYGDKGLKMKMSEFVGICRILSEFVGFNLLKIQDLLSFMLVVQGLLN